MKARKPIFVTAFLAVLLFASIAQAESTISPSDLGYKKIDLAFDHGMSIDPEMIVWIFYKKVVMEGKKESKITLTNGWVKFKIANSSYDDQDGLIMAIDLPGMPDGVGLTLEFNENKDPKNIALEYHDEKDDTNYGNTFYFTEVWVK